MLCVARTPLIRGTIGAVLEWLYGVRPRVVRMVHGKCRSSPRKTRGGRDSKSGQSPARLRWTKISSVAAGLEEAPMQTSAREPFCAPPLPASPPPSLHSIAGPVRVSTTWRKSIWQRSDLLTSCYVKFELHARLLCITPKLACLEWNMCVLLKPFLYTTALWMNKVWTV